VAKDELHRRPSSSQREQFICIEVLSKRRGNIFLTQPASSGAGIDGSFRFICEVNSLAEGMDEARQQLLAEWWQARSGLKFHLEVHYASAINSVRTFFEFGWSLLRQVDDSMNDKIADSQLWPSSRTNLERKFAGHEYTTSSE